MKTKILLPIITVFLISMFVQASTVWANTGGFALTPIFPENQDPDTQGFFNIMVTAGQQQEISVRIRNFRDEPITVELSLITASTNRNGIIEYSSPGIQDETMAYAFADIARFLYDSEEIYIPAGQSVDVPIVINIPEEGFDGIILGAVHALLGITDEEIAAAGTIINRFAGVIPVRLQENDIRIAPDFLLGDVHADVINRRPAVVAEIRNPAPRVTLNVLARVEIIPVGADEPVLTRTNVNVDFAPNSIFHFTITDDMGIGLEAGDYIARVGLEHREMSWSFESQFEILPGEAERLQEAALNIQRQIQSPTGGAASPLQTIIIAGTAVLVILSAIVLAIKSKKVKRTNEELQRLKERSLEQRLERLGIDR